MDKKDWTPEELELKEALNKLYETDTSTPSKPLDLSFMNETAEIKSRKRRRRLAYIAAAVMLVFASSFATAIFISNDYASAVQDKIQRKVFEKKYGVVVATDEEFAEEGETVWEITDFETAKKAKEIIPDLPIPGYMPEGYEFEKLVLHLYDNNDYYINYICSSSDNTLYINTNPLHAYDASAMLLDGDVTTLDDRKLIFWSDITTSTKGVYILSSNQFIQITPSNFHTPDNELINIAKGLNF